MKKKTVTIFAVSAVLILSFAALGRTPGFLNEIFTSIKESSISQALFSSKKEKDIKPPQPNSGNIKQSADVPGTSTTTPEVPDEIVYFILFNHLVGLKGEAEKMQARGETLDYHRMYQDQATLDLSQSQQLFQIAQECLDAIKPIDKQARAVIEEARAAYPNGEVSAMVDLPPPPAELERFQQEKDAVILNYRDSLQNYLGKKKFQEFDAFARARIVPNVERNLTAMPNTGIPAKEEK
jgi:hypothetical protein